MKFVLLFHDTPLSRQGMVDTGFRY